MKNKTAGILALGALSLAFTSACSIRVSSLHTVGHPVDPCIETEIKKKTFELALLSTEPDVKKTVRNKCTGETLYEGAVP